MKSVASYLCIIPVLFVLLFAGAVQAEVMLQWFETDWDEMYQKMPKVAEIGYSSLWIPPPTKGPVGTSVKWANVGYNLYDRFDIGDVPQRGTRETRYGTRGSLRAMVDNAHGMDIKIIPDIVMNHNGNGPDFREYPGMTATDFHVKWNEGYCNTLNYERAPRMNWWYHHEGYGGTMWSDLANLADIRTEDHPLNPDPKRFTGYKTDSDGNSFDFVDGTSYLRHVGQYDRYPYYPAGYTNENAAELLYRWITWLGDAMDYDGLRLDAGKHTPYEFFGWRGSGFLHEAQWNYTQRRGYDFGGDPTDLFQNDRDRTNAFIFAEILSPWSEIEYWYRQGTGNPMRFLDYQMKKTADAAFTGNMSGLGAYGSDFGPSTGITYVWGHDEALASGGKANLAYAYILGHIGVPMVYYTGNNIEWADHGRTAYPNARTWMIPGYDEYALGEGGSGAIPNLVWINRNFARGNEVKRWDNDADFFALERYDDRNGNGIANAGEGIMILALNDSGGDISKSLSCAFPDGTVLKDFTGNNATEVTVSGGSAYITVPGNGGQGWVVYAPLCADGVTIDVQEGGSPAGTMTWIHPGGVHSTDSTQQLTRITADTITIETEATDVPTGITVDNIMLRWGNGVQLPVTNYFDSGRGEVSGRYHNTDRSGDTFSLTFSTTNLSEGLHTIKARAFTQRDPSYSAVFNTATKVVYMDRHGPELVLDVPGTFKGDEVLYIGNPDYTAYDVFVSVDGGGEVQADMKMKGSFEYPLVGLSAAAHTISVRATEYDYASPRAQINQSTATTNVTVQTKDNAALALALDCPDKVPGDSTAELPFFKIIASGASSGARLYWEGYELPWNGGNYTNTFDGQVIQRDNESRVVTNRLWGSFINGNHCFILDDGSDTVVLHVTLNLYGNNHIDSDGDGLPDNVEMPYFDDGAPGPDQPWPGDSNNNFIPESWESWSRLNPYNHATFYSAQWDDRGDMDGDNASNYDEVLAGYFEGGNIYQYDIYDSNSTPSGSGTVASTATVLPTTIHTGDVITITYTPNDGTLSGIFPVVMHIGHSKKTEGSWQDVIDTNMTASGDSWTASYTVPDNATSVDVTFFDGGSIWDGSDWQFNVSGAEGPAFIMDAQLDSAAYEIAEYNGMKLWAAVRGSTLYVATWGTGPYSEITNDHFILVRDDLGDAAPAPWAKNGYVFLGSNTPYLGAEGGNEWSGWFNTSGPTTNANSNLNPTYNYLEGTIDLADNFGSIPEALYMAVGAYGSGDGDSLVAQVPEMWDDNSNIEIMEILRVPIASIRDESADGNFDGGSPVMYTVVNDDTNNANYGLRRFFLDEVKNDQEHITVLLDPHVGGTNVVSDVELFSNLNRRDFAKMPGDEDPDTVTPTSIDTYYLATPMTDEGGGGYSATLAINRCGAYRINARFKVNGGPWVYYTDNGLRRDCAVVVSPKKALETTLYELNPLTAEATTDQFAGRSTFRNMYLDDTGRPNGISTNLLRELGVNMVWLQPIHPIGAIGREIDPSTGLDYDPGSPYAVKDYWQVNAVLGDPNTETQAMTEFTDFVSHYDDNGIGVMLDGTFNHSAWDCQIGQMGVDLDIKNGQGVTVAPSDPISAVRPAWYSMRDNYGDPATYFNDTNDTDIAVAPDRIDFGKWSDAAEFFFGRYDCLVQQPASNPDWVWSSSWASRYLREDDLFEGFNTDATRELWEYFAAYPTYWLEKTGHPAGTPKTESYKGIDGLRCDFAQGLPSLFWEYAINKTRSVKWDFLFMAESLDGYRTVNGSNRHGVGYRSSRHFDILNENILYLWRNDFFNYRVWSDQLTSNPDRTTSVIFDAFDNRKNAYELSPLLLTLVSHDEIFPTDDQWSLAYAYAINAAMDGVPMVFYGQEMGAQNDYYEYGAGNPDDYWTNGVHHIGNRSDFGIDSGNNFDRYESNFGKSIPHFKRYNHMTNIWNSAWASEIHDTYGRVNQARENSPALKSQHNYFLSDVGTDAWNPDIFAVAKFQEPGAPVSTQDVVIAFVNNDFRAEQARAASFKLDATTGSGANWFGIEPSHVYNVVDIASTNPTALLWGGGITGSTLIANGIYVGFQTNESFYGGQAQFIRLLDTTAGMTATSVNDMFANEDRIPAPVIAPISNRFVAVSNTLAFTVNVTVDPADTVTNTCQSSLAPDNWSYTGSNSFSFTPMPNETGTHSFLFTSTGIDGYDEELITITVTPDEDPTDYEQWATAAGMDPDGPNGGPSDNFDGDPYTNEQEYWSDTSPTNADSFLRILMIDVTGDNLSISMDKNSTAPRSYIVHSAPGLDGDSWDWAVLGTNQSTDGILPLTRTNHVLMFKVTIPPPQ